MSYIMHSLLHNDFTKMVKAFALNLVRKEKLIRRFVNLEDYAKKHPESITIVCKGKENTIYAENQTNMDYETVLKVGREIDTSVVLVKNASCFAYSDLILLDDSHCYCETREDPVIGDASDCSDGYILRLDKRNYHLVSIPRQKQCVKEGIFLSGLFSWNYYHFTFQILAKLHRAVTIAPEIPLLVDRKAEEIPSFTSLLKICNIQHRPIVMLDENVQYKVENLYLVSSPTILLPNYKKGVPIPTVGCFYCPSALRYLREMMVSRGACGFNYPNRIFLSRKNVTSGRRSFNEEECTACAKRFGFKVVYPEMMTFEQQIGLFHNAKYIIGGSGAAFTNLVYCSQGVKVVVLCKFHSNLGIWQPIVEYVGGKMCCLEENEGQTQPPQVIHDSFRIDIDKLEGVLANIIGE